MLISCQFRFGALVVGSSSMSDSINKGDVIIYDDNEIKNLKIGDVIVFNRGSTKIVHRIVNMKTVNNEYIYYTKGDNNSTEDEGYVNKNDIYGKVVTSIPKIGMPTLYLHDAFDKSEGGL
jgi:signal peptidase I